MSPLSTSSAAQVEAFVARHLPEVRGYLFVLGCPPRLLDDLVQDVFLGVLRSGFEERGLPQTRAYLRRAARSTLIRALERERRLPAASELAEAEAAWMEYEEADGGDTYLTALRACLAHLKERARTVLLLRYSKRLGRAEVGRELGISEEGVKSILARAKRSLRSCVERRIGA